MQVELITCALGAELKGVSLAEAAKNADLAGEIRQLMLKHKVLFLRDQHISDEEHAAFARQFGELEDHPLAPSAVPGITQIWKTPDSPPERYENAWHTNAHRWAVTPCGRIWSWLTSACPSTSRKP